MSEHKCEGVVLGAFRNYLCGKNAAYEHEGKWFCKTHNPPTIKQKSDAPLAVFEARWEAQKATSKAQSAALAELQRRADCYPDLLTALIDLERTAGIASMYADPGRVAARAVIAKATTVTP